MIQTVQTIERAGISDIGHTPDTVENAPRLITIDKQPSKGIKAPPNQKLTLKQQIFVTEYIANGGNGTKAAEKARYKGNPKQLGIIACQNLGKLSISSEIDRLQAPIIAERAQRLQKRGERQAFWASIADNPEASTSDRLRASELLGKSYADFTDNISTTDTTRQAELDRATAEESAELARIRLADKYHTGYRKAL